LRFARPPRFLYPANMKEKETKISDAAILLERAERQATSNPAAALPTIQKALRACRRAGVQCLETRALATLGAILSSVGRLKHSEDAFRVAYSGEGRRRARSGHTAGAPVPVGVDPSTASQSCPCCRPVVDRLSAYLLNKQGRKREAVERASRAVETARKPEQGRAFVTLGIVRFYAGDVSGAVQALTEALEVLPVRSPHHGIAQTNLAAALAHSKNPEDVRRAAAMLHRLERRFRGIKRISVERAKLAWTVGQVLARLADLEDGITWKRRSLLDNARKRLKAAVSNLAKLGLFLDATAARSDLAAILAQLDPLAVLETVEGIPGKGKQDGRPFDVSEVRTAAIEAASVVFTPERKAKLWEALRTLRAAIVDAGAPPPIVAYGPT